MALLGARCEHWQVGEERRYLGTGLRCVENSETAVELVHRQSTLGRVFPEDV